MGGGTLPTSIPFVLLAISAYPPQRQLSSSLGDQMRLRSVLGVILCIPAMGMLGCTWVPLTAGGERVRVLQGSASTSCEKLMTVNAKTTDRIGIFARSDRKIREELESLARNEAAEADGNTIVPIGTSKNGRQSFVVYRCPQR